MEITCCDICKKPLNHMAYKDSEGNKWESISFREHKYSRSRYFFFTGTYKTEYLSVCGYCRSELAKHNPAKRIGE